MTCPRCHLAIVDHDLICPRCGAGPPPGRRVPLTAFQKLSLVAEQAALALGFLALGGLLLAMVLRDIGPGAVAAAAGTLIGAGWISLVAWALRRELPGVIGAWALDIDDTLLDIRQRGRATRVLLRGAGELPLPPAIGRVELIEGARYRLLYSPLQRRLWRIELIARPGDWAEAPIQRPDWL